MSSPSASLDAQLNTETQSWADGVMYSTCSIAADIHLHLVMEKSARAELGVELCGDETPLPSRIATSEWRSARLWGPIDRAVP